MAMPPGCALPDPLALERIARQLPLRETARKMQDMHIAVALQELAEGCTGDAVLIRTVYDNLVLFVERLQRLT